MRTDRHTHTRVITKPVPSLYRSAQVTSKTTQKFKTSNIRIVQLCQELFHFELPSVLLARRRKAFLSRVSILMRDIDIANLSVCLSVRNVPVSDENGLTYRHSFLSASLYFSKRGAY